ncbi:MAG: serine kinase of the HPr protein regulates carbohydrate metabolism [Gammaproteobacteria bacterium]|nr:serine kinase of the HPr protein regulates carbohydrate metabolism [Gammaproteobacteria bacterium]
MINSKKAPDLLSDPFQEFTSAEETRCFHLLGAQVHFECNSRRLLKLVDAAYAGLPSHRLPGPVPRLRVRLLLSPTGASNRKKEPPPLTMIRGPGLLGGTSQSANVVVVSPTQHTALIVVSPNMLRSPYHVRYELIEFAVFTLAARVQELVPLHAACVSAGGRGILLMGESGAGKSTVALHCLQRGLEFVAEDGVFVSADTMRATGVANYVHLRTDSLRWIDQVSDRRTIRHSPLIRRRSGVKKFEVDLRRLDCRLAAAPPEVGAIVFMSPQGTDTGPILRPMSRAESVERLTDTQNYAANQPGWSTFLKNAGRLEVFELRRGRHPREAVDALQALLGDGIQSRNG